MSEVLENDLDLSEEIGISTEYPLVARTRTRVLCQEASIEQNDEGLKRWQLKLALQEPAKSTSGDDLQVGFVVTDSFLVSEKGKYTKKMIAQNVFRRTDAFGLERAGKPNPKDLVGREAEVILATRTDDQGVERQTFSYISPKM